MRSLYRLIVTIALTFHLVGALAQDLSDHQVTLSCIDLPLEQILEQIETQTGISFSYSSRHVPVSQKITIHIDGLSLEKALDELFVGLNLDYTLIENKLILRKTQKSDPKKFTISGYLRDNQDGETLIGATILVAEIQGGTVSNPYGFYSITLPEGRYNLRYSFIGYELQEQTIVLTENLVLDIHLKRDFSVLKEVVIAPKDSLKSVEIIHANASIIDKSIVLTKPSSLGEPDVIKSLDILPGVQLFRDGSTFYNVRGGDRDQNQMLVDEAPIYNPAHLLGLFSSFLPEAIKDAKLYKGNAPADYGGRISSVLDIYTKDGNRKEFHIGGRLGLVSGRLNFEGPFKKDKSSYFVSGRRSHIAGIARGLGVDFQEFYFSDFTAKVNLRLNNKNRLFLSTFRSKDEYLNGGGLRWENTAGTIRWNHIFNDRLFSNTTFYASRYEYNLIPDRAFFWKNHISNASIKSDFTLYQSPKSTAKFGLKISGHNFNPGNLEDRLGNEYSFVPKKNATEFSLYYSTDRQLAEKWLLTWGLRLSTWTNYGKTIEYHFDESYNVVDSTIADTRHSYNSYANLEPRINLTFLADNHNFLKFNYSRASQYINLISNSISPFNNLEVWLPASLNIKPQQAKQIALGWIHDREKWQLSLDSYYKFLENQLDYTNQAELLLNPHLEGELRSGKGRAYGIETMLSKTNGKLTGWISYAYSRSFRKIAGINDGRKYATLWDKPHQFATNVNFKKSERVNWSGTLMISSGAPVTSPTSFYQYQERIVPVYSQKHNDRLPTYHRFDVAWQYRLNNPAKNWSHFLTISLFNFYAQKNTILESFNKIEIDDGVYRVPTDVNTQLAITPTHRFVYQLVPSISYSLNL